MQDVDVDVDVEVDRPSGAFGGSKKEKSFHGPQIVPQSRPRASQLFSPLRCVPLRLPVRGRGWQTPARAPGDSSDLRDHQEGVLSATNSRTSRWTSLCVVSLARG